MSKTSDSDDERERNEYKSSYENEEKNSEQLTNNEILEKVQNYFYTDDDLLRIFETYVKENCHYINLDSEEYDLKYTELYNEYKGMFEDKIEHYLKTINLTALDLYQALKEATEDDPNSNNAIFGQILYAVSDFDIFMTMMREGAEEARSKSNRK